MVQASINGLVATKPLTNNRYMAIIEVPGNTGSFLIGCIRFYEDLLNDIKICKRKVMALQEEIQCCFEIATNYAGKLAADVSVYSFEPGTD